MNARRSTTVAALMMVLLPGAALCQSLGRDAAARIRSAESAAPPAIASSAAVLEWPEADAAAPAVLRNGSNGWVCFPDNPMTPGQDPMCMDEVWQALFDAWSRHAPFVAKGVGTAYMLGGGADASMTDPFLTEPAAGHDWVISGPHVMLVVPPSRSGTGPLTYQTDGGPYLMWAGTPYEHIMMPVR